jgi:hypothetical protein
MNPKLLDLLGGIGFAIFCIGIIVLFIKLCLDMKNCDKIIQNFANRHPKCPNGHQSGWRHQSAIITWAGKKLTEESLQKIYIKCVNGCDCFEDENRQLFLTNSISKTC